MSSFAFLVLCVQACLIQNAFASCGCNAPLPALPVLPAPVTAGCGYGAGLNGYGARWAGNGLGLVGNGLGLAGYGAALPSYVPELTGYGGSGVGNVAVAGELPVAGSAVLAGQVPIIGTVEYCGPVAAAGAVTISGHCAQHCGCDGYVY